MLHDSCSEIELKEFELYVVDNFALWITTQFREQR